MLTTSVWDYVFILGDVLLLLLEGDMLPALSSLGQVGLKVYETVETDCSF